MNCPNAAPLTEPARRRRRRVKALEAQLDFNISARSSAVKGAATLNPSRAGRGPKRRDPPMRDVHHAPQDRADSPSFLADVMVGRLAKWLRGFGFDTLYYRRLEFTSIQRLLDDSARFFLTRNVKLARRFPTSRVVFIEHDRLAGQLRQVMATFHVDLGQRAGARCMRCNDLLRAAPREEVFGRVPEYIYYVHDAFFQCPRCRRYYWEGSHRQRMQAWLDAELKNPPSS